MSNINPEDHNTWPQDGYANRLREALVAANGHQLATVVFRMSDTGTWMWLFEHVIRHTHGWKTGFTDIADMRDLTIIRPQNGGVDVEFHLVE